MMNPESFRTGDKVRHMSGKEGQVINVNDVGVHVDFGRPGLRGIYDANWFRLHPNGLEIITSAQRQGERQ